MSATLEFRFASDSSRSADVQKLPLWCRFHRFGKSSAGGRYLREEESGVDVDPRLGLPTLWFQDAPTALAVWRNPFASVSRRLQNGVGSS
jgi:hypothetical protein